MFDMSLEPVSDKEAFHAFLLKVHIQLSILTLQNQMAQITILSQDKEAFFKLTCALEQTLHPIYAEDYPALACENWVYNTIQPKMRNQPYCNQIFPTRPLPRTSTPKWRGKRWLGWNRKSQRLGWIKNLNFNADTVCKRNKTNSRNRSWQDWDKSFGDIYTPNFNTHYSDYEYGD